MAWPQPLKPKPGSAGAVGKPGIWKLIRVCKRKLLIAVRRKLQGFSGVV